MGSPIVSCTLSRVAGSGHLCCHSVSAHQNCAATKEGVYFVYSILEVVPKCYTGQLMGQMRPEGGKQLRINKQFVSLPLVCPINCAV